MTIPRCSWANPANPRYLDYHDHEWGTPCHDENRLFEMLNLEGAQAGLSWETVLNKRDSYRAAFDGIAARHPDKVFVWIDIEDQADVVGDLDVENFPTLLVQRDDTVAFFGTMLPDPAVAERLVKAQAELAPAELARLAQSSAERRAWQRDCNLRTLLQDAS
ncbi:MAG TPA: hypothetical protein DDZ22_05605 [Massilia sp.]|nr:hypothetical protein [Massilia sp.]